MIKRYEVGANKLPLIFPRYNAENVPHRYNVQVSDTTMLSIDKMLVKKLYLRNPDFFGIEQSFIAGATKNIICLDVGYEIDFNNNYPGTMITRD